jgi:hypothetical protein
MLNYISIKPDLIDRQIVETDEYYWSRKLDGHFVKIVKSGKDFHFYTKSGRAIDLPNIKIKNTDFDGEFLGELVLGDGKLCTNAEVSAGIAANAKDLQIFVFAAKNTEGILPISKFLTLKIEGENISKINWNKATSRTEIKQAFESVVALKGEGIVVLTESGFVYKLKPIQTIDLVVVGYSLNIGENAGQLRDILLGVVDQDQNINLVARTSAGINNSNAEELLNKFSKINVKSNYTEVSSAKTAFIFIAPQIVAQCTCLDIQAENASGVIFKPMLAYDNKDGYSFLKDAPSVSVASLVFQNIRIDKEANAEHAGWNQIKPFLNESENKEAAQNLMPSTIEIKEVYTKDGKNGLAVRKLLLIKTNKEQTGKFSSYINFYTDYSPGRKSPLDTDIFLHQSLEEAKIKFAALKEENIKKGWEKVN